MILAKLLNYLYLPVMVLTSAVFLMINGLSFWPRALFLAGGLLAGWFLLLKYPKLLKSPYLNLVFRSLVFQVGFLLFSFWLIISSQSFFSSGLALGVNLFLFKELISDYQSRRLLLKKRLFNNIEISDRSILAYAIIFGLAVAFLIFLVLI